MRKLVWPVILALTLAACGDRDTQEPQGEVSSAASLPEESAAPPVEEGSAEAAVSSLQPLPMEEYGAYTAQMDGDQPTLEELEEFLLLNLEEHGYSAWADEFLLFAVSREDDDRVIGKTQLLACAVTDYREGWTGYVGVDRITGHLLRWQGENPESVERLANFQLFHSPRAAVSYIRRHYWDEGWFATPYELELREGDFFPAYVSQTVDWGDGRSSQYIIEISSQDEEAYVVHCYQDIRDSETEGHTATTGWYTVRKNGFISDMFDGRAIAIPHDPVPDRVYWRYRVEDAVWTEEEAAFPAPWLEAAGEAVCREVAAESAVFIRGWSYDFNGDGGAEAIVQLQTPHVEEDQFYMDLHYVYVDKNGQATYLVNCGVGAESDGWLMQYDGFVHIVLRHGDMTAAGSRVYTIYSAGNTIVKLFDPYALDLTDGVFLLTGIPQNFGRTYHFWDSYWERYSTVAPVEISVTEFFQIFNPAKTTVDPNLADSLTRLDFHPEDLVPGMVERVEVFGNLHYQLFLTQEDIRAYPESITVTRGPYGTWDLNSIGLLSSLSWGYRDARRSVYDVDMEIAEQTARSPG